MLAGNCAAGEQQRSIAKGARVAQHRCAVPWIVTNLGGLSYDSFCFVSRSLIGHHVEQVITVVAMAFRCSASGVGPIAPQARRDCASPGLQPIDSEVHQTAAAGQIRRPDGRA